MEKADPAPNRRDSSGELIAPAGDPERLRMAVHYGADAVYCGLKELGMRAGASNFTPEELADSVAFAHHRGVKVYATVNVFAHNRHLKEAGPLLRRLEECGVDALIVSDPGLAETAASAASRTPLHLSTQAGVTNWKSALFWHRQGFKRINLARELTLEEIEEIRRRVPQQLELEAFVHGSMCMAYSGRCLLSAYWTGRSANLGECTQPCRWSYYLVEESRPGEPLPVIEEEGGSYVLSSRDLCMIEHLPRLLRAGVEGLKIEGRMKTIHYVATVTRLYRRALEKCRQSPERYTCLPEWREELEKVSHRPYSTGFYFGSPLQVDPEERQSYYKQCLLAGVVLDYDPGKGTALVEQRNRFRAGDTLEVLSPFRDPLTLTVKRMYTPEGKEISVAPHPRQRLLLPTDQPLYRWDLLRLFTGPS